MKKFLILAFVLMILVCSCSTVKFSRNKGPEFARFGSAGEIVITGNAKYFLPNVPCVNDMTLVFKGDEMYGILKGVYSKPVLDRVISRSSVKINDVSDFDYHYYGWGKTFFSTSEAEKQFNERILNGDILISAEDIEKIQGAGEFAIYAYRPDIGVRNVEKLLLAKYADTFNLMVTCEDEKTALSFFKLLKSDFYSFEVKDGISTDLIMTQIDEHFFISDKSVYILDLVADNYLDNWIRRILNYGSI